MIKTCKIDLNIYPSKSSFAFGNCAIIAIAGAFDLCPKTLTIWARSLGMNPSYGLDFNECKKVINLLGKLMGYKVEYVSNPAVYYVQLNKILTTGTFIVDLGEHLSLLQEGKIYDSHLINSGYDAKELGELIPTGWWKIS